MTTQRRCGDCTLCCRLLPVRELEKLANQRCQHQGRGGCAVYHSPLMPPSCALWNCRWIVNDDTADQRRPDRSHFVIDLMPDFITARDNDTGETQSIPVVQIWVDPDYRDAHRDPALRRYLARRGEQDGAAAIIRYNSEDAFILFPPALCADRRWHEEHGGTSTGRTHTLMETLQAIGGRS